MSDDQTHHSLREQVRAARLRFADSAADLGVLLRLLGEYAEAERLLRQAVEIYEADRRTPPDRPSRTPQELS
ncbi:tetratricopeptide repeat protein [Streptomyces cylindrosporus]|uniref:Tetratricopeptide repeat protein n=1 Tax=Streptomyces cylindrosporus TaxID=2927583 RepID=A0ABS9XYK2_9ACTN|nr:tetratricopeptide repeat protein [Streptomyces cylindrosporus]MCI3270035.1 tetratricopeptide repeat protein [Streptomyces cylindrosporus]